MKGKTLTAIVAATALTILALAPAARADFGLKAFEASFTNQDGTPATQAGSHPFAVDTFFELNHHEEGGEFFVDGGDVKDLILETARGFIGSATAVPRCATIDFVTEKEFSVPNCPLDTAIGITAAVLKDPSEPSATLPAAIYNLTPPPGVAARIGFSITKVPLIIDIGLKVGGDHNIVAKAANIPQPLTVFGGAAQIWGVPADPAHDFARGQQCAFSALGTPPRIIDGKLNLTEGGSTCPSGAEEKPFLTLPRACQGPLLTGYELDSWSEPGVFAKGSDPLAPLAGCDKLEFAPEISSQATADSTGTSTGLDFEIDFEDEVDPGSEGLSDPEGIAGSEIKKTVVTLPEGMTVNPSIGEGLGVCTLADLDRETLAADPGEGCPNASKIGTVRVDTPIVDQSIEGSVFLAQQDDPDTAAKENPFDSLIAFYIVFKNQDLGALIKVPAKVEPDPVTGRLITTVEDIPQIPFARFSFHFREGQRAPLITPSTCGTHTTEAEFTSWARPGETVSETADFQITRGLGGGPCPPAGTPPFHPGFQAGSLNAGAGQFSPFYMRLTRADGEQDMTKFSSILPPGVIGSLAGVDKCPEAQIALAKAKSGRAELRSPSCPANSRIGRTLAGAGVGSALTHVAGGLYLAGPHKGAPLSVAAITPAVAGPFDAGTVVVRIALDLNPKTAEVEVDGAASDPIPHILKGIVLNLRELEVFVDRPDFTLNPTSCAPSQTRATLFGSFRDVFNPADDVPVSLSAPYQAVNCARLPFKPAQTLRLRGGTGRGAHPSLLATLRTRPGDANLERAVVRLPRSAFLDQAHIRTICTRVQFAADACPRGAVYGHVSAFTPLLDEPLSGPVYLRSSDHKLPDLVLDLHGIVDVEASARIDSIRGGIRTTFEAIPDAPVSKVVVSLRGADKGLIVNSRNLCRHRNRASILLDAHNGQSSALHPLMQAQCRKGLGAVGGA